MLKHILTILLATTAVHALSQTVKIDGSSTVYPITEGIAEDYQKSTKIKVTVGISGTGGGFKKFCRAEIDVQNASRPILEKEIDDCKREGVTFYELPIAFDALTVVVNPKNDFVNYLTVEELKKMWEPAAQGKITNWNQVNPRFPNKPLKLFGAGSDSGTFDYFTEAITGKSKASRGDYTASEDDNVLVQGVASDIGALGYFGYAYYAENSKRVKPVSIVNKLGQPIAPSETSVMNGTYNPLSRPIFIYVNAKSLDKPEVRKFVEYYMKSAATVAQEVKYVPLPASVYQANLKHLDNKRVGTVFGGHNEVGMTVEELTKREVR
jgi:phosphate transport system substrate-binding protein